MFVGCVRVIVVGRYDYVGTVSCDRIGCKRGGLVAVGRCVLLREQFGCSFVLCLC